MSITITARSVPKPPLAPAALLEAVRARVTREEETLKAIRESRYQGFYGKS